MGIPLYTDNIKRHLTDLNYGLYFNKFLNTWKTGWSLQADKQSGNNPKLKWIELFTNNKLGNQKRITEYLARRENLLTSHKAEALYLKTNAALVTGMGNSHPIENGMTWHHTLGIPYIPASSVKGLVREWLENWLIVDEKEQEQLSQAEKDNQKAFLKDLERIFGSLKKSDAKSVGTVVFHDAIPAKPIQLKAEIMTPHYGDYYEKGEVPGDWLNPNPITFLAVEEGQIFQFAVMPRRFNNADDIKDYELAQEWLSEVIKNLGIGAKTATGYGQYECIEEDNVDLITIREGIIDYQHEQEEAIAKATLTENQLMIRSLTMNK